MYSSVGMRSDQIYVVGKASKKQHLAAKVIFLLYLFYIHARKNLYLYFMIISCIPEHKVKKKF